jgi:integrase
MAQISNRTHRLRLSAGKRHWQVIEPGLAIGYRRPAHGGAGTWSVRLLVADRQHRIAALGTADDLGDGAGMSWKQAQAAAREWAAKQTSTGPLTVEGAVLEYAADLQARKGERPAREMIGRMRKHLPPALGARQVADLTAADLTGWRNGLVDHAGDEEEARRSRDTANRLLTMLRGALNFAFNTGRVADDRAWRRLKGFRGAGEARKAILSESELQRLIDACPDGLRELVAAGALTGARLGELTAARVRDFDADAAILTVSGKTGERPIHLPPAAVVLLSQQASGKRPQDYLLTTAAGGRWTASLHSRPFAVAVERAGLDPATVFYSLRHSWISGALVRGVPTKAVADHTGTSIAMLQRYYARFIPGDQRRYAAMAAPALTIEPADHKVVPLRTG